MQVRVWRRKRALVPLHGSTIVTGHEATGIKLRQKLAVLPAGTMCVEIVLLRPSPGFSSARMLLKYNEGTRNVNVGAAASQYLPQLSFGPNRVSKLRERLGEACESISEPYSLPADTLAIQLFQ